MQIPIRFKLYNQFLLVIAIVFLLLIFWNVLLANFFFAFIIHPSAVLFYTAVFFSVLSVFIISTKYFFINWKIILIGILTAVLIFLYVKIKAEKYYDVSWDGQAYQMEAVLQMMKGWNPVKNYLDNSSKQENIYINHYPRGAWYNAFSFYLVSGNIESGKLFNYLWIVIASCFGTVVLNQFFKLNFFIAFIIALVAATNPVAIYQSTSNYIDGQVAAGMLTFILLAVFIFFNGNIGSIILLSVTILLMINYKFSLPFYLIVMSAGVIFIFWIYKNNQAIKKFIYSALIGFAFGVCVLGFSPYISNLIDFKNPIYPLFENSLPEITRGIEESIQPASFETMNRFERLFQSTFSKGIWSRTPDDNVLKIPGTFTADEKLNYSRPDCEMAGFGPYYSLAFLISILLLPFIFFVNRNVFYLVLLIIGFLFLSILITKVGWLARYAPQFFLVCLVIVVAAFYLKTFALLLPAAICLTLLIKNDTELLEINYVSQNKNTNDLQNTLTDLSKRSDTVLVYFDHFNCYRERFKNNNIKFREVKSIKELRVDSPKYFKWVNNRIATN